MKRIKQTLKKIMRYTLYTAIATGAMYLVIWYLNDTQETTQYNAPKIVVPAQPEQPTESDVEMAERMLAEATAKLDAEETKLEEEIATIKAESQAEVDEREAKIAEINQIRTSF